MKKVCMVLLLLFIGILLVCGAYFHICCKKVRSSVKCIMNDTVVTVQKPSRDYVVSEDDRSYLCYYWGFTNDDFDDYRDHQNQYGIAEITLTIVNDSNKSLRYPQLKSPKNAKYWFNVAALSEDVEYEIPANSSVTKAVGVLIRMDDTISEDIKIDAKSLPFELCSQIHIGIATSDITLCFYP